VAGGPENSPSTGNLVSRVRLEPGVFRPYAVNWIELCQQSGALLYVPYLPVALEPCIPALWSETEDPWRPPRPS
jgi:hypothetical protein